MSNSREIKRHIQSVKSTQQITKAMKVVSAAKLHKTQTAALASRPYTRKLTEAIKNITENMQEIQNPLMQSRPCKKVAIVLMTGNKGLAGGFNGNLIRLALSHAKEKYSDCVVDYIPVGSKGRDFLRSHEMNVPVEFVEISDLPRASETEVVAEYVIEHFLSEEYDVVEVVYEAFLTPGSQEPKVRLLLPVDFKDNLTGQKSKAKKTEFLYEPDPVSILNALIPMYINNILYQTALETKASEFVARLMAMGVATENAEKMIGSLVLSYNRSRQAAITKELSEIMGGANALEEIEKEIEEEAEGAI